MARRRIRALLAGFVAFAGATRAEWPQDNAIHRTDSSGEQRPPAILWRLRPDAHNGDRCAFSAVAYSYDEKLMATGGLSPSVCVWDVATGKELFRPAGHKDFAVAVAFAPDGKLLASGGNDNLVRLWSPTTGRLIRELRGHTGCPTCLAFAPDGKVLAVGDDEKTIRVWDLESGKQVRSFIGHKDSIRSVAFVLNGKAVLSCSSKESVRLWDRTTGNQLYRWDDRPSGPLASSPDGKVFACPCHDGSVALWDIGTRTEIRRLSGETAFENVAFSPDGRLVAAAGDRGRLIVWEVSTGKPTHRWQNLGAWTLRCDSMTFTTDGRALTTAGIDFPSVVVWDLTGWGQKTPPMRTLAEDAWIALWTQLGTENARRAHQAIWSLVAEPQRAVRLFQQHLKPAGGILDKCRVGSRSSMTSSSRYVRRRWPNWRSWAKPPKRPCVRNYRICPQPRCASESSDS